MFVEIFQHILKYLTTKQIIIFITNTKDIYIVNMNGKYIWARTNLRRDKYINIFSRNILICLLFNFIIL